MKKKILFRADGNSKTGLGHLFQLFALVEMYKENYEFTFLTRADSVLDIIPKEYSLELVPTEVDYQEESNWIAKEFLSSDYIMIADGYQFDSEYQKKIKQGGYFLMYVEGLLSLQNLKLSYHDVGQFYWFDIEKVLSSKKMIQPNTCCVVIDEMRAQDIDNLSDWKLAELKYQLVNNPLK